MARLALFSSLLLAAALSVDLVGFNLTGPAQSVCVALLTSQCGLLAFVLLLVPGRPLARSALLTSNIVKNLTKPSDHRERKGANGAIAPIGWRSYRPAFLLATAAAMSAVFQLPPDLLVRLLAVNAAAAMAVGAAGYRCSLVAAVDANNHARNDTQEIDSAPRRFQFSLSQQFALITLVSLFLGFMKLWPPLPSQSLDVPLLVAVAFAVLSGFATIITLTRQPCYRAVWMMFFAAIGITAAFLRIRYPQLGSWGFALVALHVTLTVAMLFVLRIAGLRIERRSLVSHASVYGSLAIAANQQNPKR